MEELWAAFAEEACAHRAKSSRSRARDRSAVEATHGRKLASLLWARGCRPATRVDHLIRCLRRHQHEDPVLHDAFATLPSEFQAYKSALHSHPLVFRAYFEPQEPNPLRMAAHSEAVFAHATLANLLSNRLWKLTGDTLVKPFELCRLARDLRALEAEQKAAYSRSVRESRQEALAAEKQAALDAVHFRDDDALGADQIAHKLDLVRAEVEQAASDMETAWTASSLAYEHAKAELARVRAEVEVLTREDTREFRELAEKQVEFREKGGMELEKYKMWNPSSDPGHSAVQLAENPGLVNEIRLYHKARYTQRAAEQLSVFVARVQEVAGKLRPYASAAAATLERVAQDDRVVLGPLVEQTLPSYPLMEFHAVLCLHMDMYTAQRNTLEVRQRAGDPTYKAAWHSHHFTQFGARLKGLVLEMDLAETKIAGHTAGSYLAEYTEQLRKVVLPLLDKYRVPPPQVAVPAIGGYTNWYVDHGHWQSTFGPLLRATASKGDTAQEVLLVDRLRALASATPVTFGMVAQAYMGLKALDLLSH